MLGANRNILITAVTARGPFAPNLVRIDSNSLWKINSAITGIFMIHLMWNFVPGQPVETESKSQTSKDTHPSLKECVLFLIVFEESIFQ